MSLDVSPDFVFGTLATDDLRLAHVRAEATGINHGHDLDPADPLPDQPITVRVTVGPLIVADHVTCYYTTDGREPAGDRGIASVGAALAMTRSDVQWDTLTWGYRDSWAGAIPGQPDRTLIRYRIQAWSAANGASTWSSEIAGVVAGNRPPGVTDEDAAAFSFSPGLWPIRRTGSYAVRVDRERVPDWSERRSSIRCLSIVSPWTAPSIRAASDPRWVLRRNPSGRARATRVHRRSGCQLSLAVADLS